MNNLVLHLFFYVFLFSWIQYLSFVFLFNLLSAYLAEIFQLMSALQLFFNASHCTIARSANNLASHSTWKLVPSYASKTESINNKKSLHSLIIHSYNNPTYLWQQVGEMLFFVYLNTYPILKHIINLFSSKNTFWYSVKS